MIPRYNRAKPVIIMTQTLSESDIFVLLQKERRRLTLTILAETATGLSAIELAKRVASEEFQDPSPHDVRNVYISLQHEHLPMLAEAEVVEYHIIEGVVRPGLTFDAPAEFLADVSDADLPWSDVM